MPSNKPDYYYFFFIIISYPNVSKLTPLFSCISSLLIKLTALDIFRFHQTSPPLTWHSWLHVGITVQKDEMAMQYCGCF